MNPLETYLSDLRDIRASGTAVKETSYYPALSRLLNSVGATLKPKVRCVINLKNAGAGIPDGGLFTAGQYQKVEEAGLLTKLLPERGVIEVKGTGDEVRTIAASKQVVNYWEKYRQVLVTNYRDFILIGQDTDGQPAHLETYRLAPDEAAFWAAVGNPSALVETEGARFVEYLKRVMLHAAPLAAPADVAWFLASYARDAKARIERAEIPALDTVRTALEQALGLTFEGKKGERFFRSTLIQTLFYGVFSAWVLWSKKHPPNSRALFDWRTAAWELHVPMIRALFEQVAAPSKLGPLDLVEALDWTAAALNRVDRASFFEKFEEGHAVQYFYEPFLQAFDPELRKELGVWYTPPEIVQYMVARVDTVLREELGLPDGLADPNVYVLDPCCGTGAYLVEVLRHIAATLQEQGGDALGGHDVKKAAMERVFGFELLPAPFVVAHLQLGLLLQNLGAPLSDQANERAGVYLTNALTGWEPPKGPKQHLVFPELEQERDAAGHIKRDTPILVVLGNPPYNGFAGVAVSEERDLSNAYRTTRQAPAPQGQGLNDLYIRFYRMAERRIAEQTGKGIVCFISNYSWLDGLSFPGMREHYLEKFDRIWIDCLNGDKYKTGKTTPEGDPDPSVFSTEFNREGIQVGTAIALMVRKAPHDTAEGVRFRHLWGKAKRADLLATAEHDGTSLYQTMAPPVRLGLPFMPTEVQPDYLSWPLLPELFSAIYSAVKTSRDLDIVAIDRSKLEQRMRAYYDSTLTDDMVRKVVPSLMNSAGRFDAHLARQHLLKCGIGTGWFVKYTYRPFDTRHVYWHPETKLLDEKREDLFATLHGGNMYLISRPKAERGTEGTPFYITRSLPDYHLTRPGSACFPLTQNSGNSARDSLFAPLDLDADVQAANLSTPARAYLAAVGIPDPDAETERADVLWMHTLTIGFSPAYLTENADGIRQDWPRIPLPDNYDALIASATLGRQVAALLDTEAPVVGVTAGAIRPELRAIAVISREGGGNLNVEAGELAVTAGWGHAGQGGVTMPAKGKVVVRDYTVEEREALGHESAPLGDRTFDVYLNEVAYWKNIPAAVWHYTIGGYQVMKKWLSYRERPLLGRALTTDEVREVVHMARRIAALLLLQPDLDANYAAVKGACYRWPGDKVNC